jgi:hypothetical protein
MGFGHCGYTVYGVQQVKKQIFAMVAWGLYGAWSSIVRSLYIEFSREKETLHIMMGDKQRRPAYHKLVLEGNLPNGIGADDGLGLHYIDGDLSCIVSSRPTAKAYSVIKERHENRRSVVYTEYLDNL